MTTYCRRSRPKHNNRKKRLDGSWGNGNGGETKAKNLERRGVLNKENPREYRVHEEGKSSCSNVFGQRGSDAPGSLKKKASRLMRRYTSPRGRNRQNLGTERAGV